MSEENGSEIKFNFEFSCWTNKQIQNSDYTLNTGFLVFSWKFWFEARSQTFFWQQNRQGQETLNKEENGRMKCNKVILQNTSPTLQWHDVHREPLDI